jgi:selenocysteine-specific elongation factor
LGGRRLIGRAASDGRAAVIVGLAGHIDHGKTSLVRALTGVAGDRLKDEKARGITIDLGFAYMPTRSGRPVGFIDVPGHERFVHTMLAGASGVDFALLTIAVDDGIMPQTREHLAILDLLGVNRGAVVLTKTDLASPESIEHVARHAKAMIVGTALAHVDVLTISALTGAGVDALRAHLEEAAGAARDRTAGKRFRLAIDRVFTLSGVGVVVTGTVLSGSVHVGDRIQLSPSGLFARVRSLHAQNRPSDVAHAGERCALNLAGPGITKDAIGRGDVALDPELHAPTDRIDARIRVLPTEKKPVGQWHPVRLHHAATEAGARIVLFDDRAIAPGEEANVQLVLDRPIAAAAHDRFVVRDVSAQRTLGGGLFLDLRAKARGRRAPERREQRAALELADPSAAFAALLETPPFAFDLAAFARDRALSVERRNELASELGLVVLEAANSKIAVTRDRWALLSSAMIERIGAHHGENPDLQGLGREQLRVTSQPKLSKPVFDVALKKLAGSGQLVLDGAFVRLPSHEVQLTPEDRAAWELVAPLLGGAQRFRPPRVRDLAGATGRAEKDLRRALKRAGRMGWADEVAHDHFFVRSTVREMAAIVSGLSAAAQDGSFSAAQFRDQVDNGRKVAIQILDFFDRHGVTLRKGDERRINPHRLDLFGPACQSRYEDGGASSPVGRPDFKSVWGSEPVSGGFDSHSLPPSPPGASGCKPP